MLAQILIERSGSGGARSKVSIYKKQREEVHLGAADEERVGGAGRDRTDDPLLAKQVLSQLSYSPVLTSLDLVGLDGFEPSTPALSRRCSNQLSYRPGLQASNQQTTDKRGHFDSQVGQPASTTGCDPYCLFPVP